MVNHHFYIAATKMTKRELEKQLAELNIKNMRLQSKLRRYDLVSATTALLFCIILALIFLAAIMALVKDKPTANVTKQQCINLLLS